MLIYWEGGWDGSIFCIKLWRVKFHTDPTRCRCPQTKPTTPHPRRCIFFKLDWTWAPHRMCSGLRLFPTCSFLSTFSCIFSAFLLASADWVLLERLRFFTPPFLCPSSLRAQSGDHRLDLMLITFLCNCHLYPISFALYWFPLLSIQLFLLRSVDLTCSF